ncbi:amidase [Luedemannella flava]|uniref:Amidase n=1 Tax=Luedemannella flava TaxID=349316 RepID=A0ABP4YT84_9ACTN
MLEQHSTWVGATARQIARAVRRGDARATEVLADHIEHARVADPEINAIRVLRAGEALAEAEQVDAEPDLADLALAGVPVLVKENTAVAGLPTWHGSAAARTAVADNDHEVVRRLRGAGAVVLGVSRMPELGLWGTTDDETGVTRNPWRPEHTAGGSSGGSAAAVAAGIVPMAHGNDGLGSIRIPAAACGLVGFKPGRGLVPYDIGVTDWLGLAEHGILATTVADVSVGFAVLAGRTPAPLVEPDPLRIAVSTRSPVTGVSPDHDTREALAAAARVLVSLGHETVSSDPVYPTKLGLLGIATWCAIAYREASVLWVPDLQQRTRRHVALGAHAWKRGVVRDSDRADWRTRCEAWFADGGFDLLLQPVLAGPPPAAEAWSSRSWRSNMAANMRYAPYAAPWNLAGFPAISVPAGLRADGLPAAVQIVGPPGSELLVLAAAAQMELAAPWRPHAPGWPRVGAQART